MLQGRSAYLSPPVYGHSHFKKFWLKKMETEDDSEASVTPPAESGGGVVLTKKPPLYAVNCTALEMKGTSPPPAAIRAAAPAEEINYAAQKSELDYTLALGVGLPDQEEEESHSYDGFSSGEEKIDKFATIVEEEAQPSNIVYGNGESNGQSAAKMCADCKTVKTPLWRNGPQGPKTLCNACGIRYKKMGKRQSSNGDRPSSPSTPPISPSCKSKIHGKRKRERDVYSGEQQEEQRHHHHQRKKMKSLAGRPSYSLQSEAYSSQVGEENRSGEALRRWRQVERIRAGLLRYGVMRNSLAEDEEEGAMLLMALSRGVASC